MVLLAIRDCLVFVLVQHSLASIARAVHFVLFPNMLLHLISRVPRRHPAWKTCNSFMYRLHIRVFPYSHSAQLCRQLFFFCSYFRKAYFIHQKNETEVGLRWRSAWALMMQQQGKTFPVFHMSSHWEIIQLMAKAGGFEGALRCKCYI